MGEYLLSVIALAVVLDLVEMLCADKFKGITKSAISVILIMAICSPLPTLFDRFRGEVDFSQISGEGEDIRLMAFEEGIAVYVADEFDLSVDEISVEAVGFDAGEMRAEKILITLFGRSATANYKMIEKAVDRLELGEAEVKIEI